MLNKINRLRKDKDYKRLVNNSRSCRFGSLNVRIALNKKNETRVGVVVGKNISKKAVIRNRIRRKLQEIIRLMLKAGVLKSGFDIMVRPDIKALNFSYQELENNVSECFKRAGVYGK